MKFHLFVFIAVILAMGVGINFARQKESAPASASQTPPSGLQRLSKKVDAAVSSSLNSATAVENRKSSLGLSWFFGGKEQRGWTVYVPLISNEIQSNTDIDSPDFAQAVERWQLARGIAQTGIVNDETWAGMIAEFQERRIKEHGYASESDLIVAPSSDFYDPDRAADLRRVNRDAYAAYQRLVSAAEKEGLLKTEAGDAGGQYLKIISAFRSREYQAQLRKASPRSGRAGLALNSPHFTGRALDLYVGGDPVDTKDSNRLIQTGTPIYKWLVKNAAKFGFRPYFYEPWHWEYGN